LKLVPEGVKARFGSQLAWVCHFPYRLSKRPIGLALAYHQVAERPGDPARELVPTHSIAQLEAQLRHLRANYRLVRASELLAAAIARRRGQRFPIAVTFDDDLRSHLQLAMPVLRRLGIPASFFLCGASLDGPHRFWWERMQLAFDRGQSSAVIAIVSAQSEESLNWAVAGIHELAGAVERLPPHRQEAVEAALSALVGPDPEDAGLRAEEVEALAREGFEIGFHTLRHYQLPCLDDAALRRALSEGRDRLSELSGGEIGIIAYPHGKAGGRVAEAARKAGFTLGFTNSWTPVRPDADPLLLGRIEPSFAPSGRLALRLARVLLS
jgi:peptidoglycan/xylan/chitin deacetylase (PgdA/CDA1 family)